MFVGIFIICFQLGICLSAKGIDTLNLSMNLLVNAIEKNGL